MKAQVRVALTWPPRAQPAKTKPPMTVLLTDLEPPAVGTEELLHCMGTTKNCKAVSVLFLERCLLCPKRTKPMLCLPKYRQSKGD